MKLLKKHIADYNKYGIIKLKLSKDIIKQKKAFLKDSISFFKNFDEKIYTKKLKIYNFQDYLLKLRKRDRNLVSKYYKISRRFASLKSLISSESIININKKLMKTELVSICHFIAVRVDFYEERNKGYVTNVHQDFPYIQGSLNGITFWMPYFSTKAAPDYIPGSHKLGLQIYKEFTINKNSGIKTLQMIRSNKFKNFKSLHCKDNEILIFSTLLIHKTSETLEFSPRLSLQLRYDDISQKEMFDKNYPEGLYLGDTFKKNFKKYVK